jgi:uncharacterized membrane protein YbhN (UPF0104 family)
MGYKMAKRKKANTSHIRQYLALIASALAIIFVYWQRVAIGESLQSIKDANFVVLTLAVLVFSLSVVFASLAIYSLRLKPKTKYRPIIVVQIASLFLGKVTPASSGGVAAMVRILNTQQHSLVQAGTVIAVAAVCTFFGNLILTSSALIINFSSIEIGSFNTPGYFKWVGLIILVAVLITVFIKKIRLFFVHLAQDITNNLAKYKKRPSKVIKAVLFGALVTLTYGTTMLLAASALGLEITLFTALIAASVGSLGVALTPTPGGAVGAEAAIAATLVQFGIAADLALATALVFRFITFWLPLIPGFVASQYALKKQFL